MRQKEKKPLSFNRLAKLAGLFGAFFCGLMALAILNAGTVFRIVFGITTFSMIGLVFTIFFILEIVFFVATTGKGLRRKGFRGTIKNGKPYISTIFGADLNFIFATIYVVIAFIKLSYFYIFIAMFYYIMVVLRLYLASIILETDDKRIAKVFIIVSAGLMILGIFMGFLVYHAFASNFMWIKNKFLLWFNVGITLIKFIFTFINLIRWMSKHQFLKVEMNLIALSFIIFTAFTIYVGYITLIDRPADNVMMIVNLSFSGVIFFIGFAALIKSILLRRKANRELIS